MSILWKTIILPQLDYCSQLWAPVKIGEMQEVEGIQRTFTSRIKGMDQLNYWERLEDLKLYSIDRRFERYRIIYAWKVLENKIESPEEYQQSTLICRTGRKYIINNPLGASKSELNSYHNTPFARMKKSFNSLPKELRNVTGVTADNFKNQLDRYISKIPDQPNVPGYRKPSQTNSIGDQKSYIEEIKCQVGGELVVATSLNRT